MSRSFAAVVVVIALTGVIVSSANADVRPIVVAVMLAALLSTVAASRWPRALASALSCCVIAYAVALGGRPRWTRALLWSLPGCSSSARSSDPPRALLSGS